MDNDQDGRLVALGRRALWVIFAFLVPTVPIIWLRFKLHNEHEPYGWWDVLAAGELLAMLQLAAKGSRQQSVSRVNWFVASNRR